MELNEVHNCKKCQGKIVLIGIDKLGVTRCGYCHQVVDYSNYFKLIVAKNTIKQIEEREAQRK